MKIDYKKYFAGKKVTKQGFGILGRGLGVVKFLLESGAEILVTDTKDESFFQEQILELKTFCENNNLNFDKIIWRLGEHRLEDFENCDFVVQASGVPKDNIYLNQARSKNISVYQEGSLFAEIIREFNLGKDEKEKIKLIGITGTRGKTTTTFLIKAILDEYVKDFNEKYNVNKKVFFGGNVQGIATLENLKYIEAGDVVVMELDSWLLQGFMDIKMSPHIAVFTNFMPDHMNYYKSMQEYFLDKANIFRFQNAEDTFVLTDKILQDWQKYAAEIKINSKQVIVNNDQVEQDKQIYNSNLIGAHNDALVSLAVKACDVLGVSNDIIKTAISNFKGVKGRLELVKTWNEVKIYNDTTATTGDATAAALNALSENKIILITGGRDKELDMTNYLQTMQNLYTQNIVKKIIFLQDDTTTGTNKILEIVKDSNIYNFEYITVNSLDEAVEETKNVSESGESILFSPAFASFGMFQNEYDRGEKFIQAINKYFV